MIEIADLFGGELYFDNFEISLVQRLGTTNTQRIALGENLIGVSEEIDYINSETSYEVDFVDLARLGIYQNEMPINLGDSINIFDEQLNINVNERVIAIDYNPFQKALPKVTVGTYLRTLTDYIQRPEEELTPPENTPTFDEFRIGRVDFRNRVSEDSQTVIDYLLGETRFPRASNTYSVERLNRLQGLFITLNQQYQGSNYYPYIIRTTNADNSSTTTVIPFSDLSTIANKSYPDIETESIILTILDRPIDQLMGNELLLNGDDTVEPPIEPVIVIAFGITLEVNASANSGNYMYRLAVGRNNISGQVSNEAEAAESFINGNSEHIIANAKYELRELASKDRKGGNRFEVLQGIYAELLEEYKLDNVKVTLIRTATNKNGESTTSVVDYTDVELLTQATQTVPNGYRESLTFVVHEKSFDDLRADNTLFEESVFSAFGIEFVPGINDTDRLYYFERFSVGSVDLLDDLSEQRENIFNHVVGGAPLEVPSNKYNLDLSQIGLFVELTSVASEEGEYITLIDQRILDGEISREVIVPYTNEQQTWNYTATYDERAIIIVVSKVPFADLNESNFNENFLTAWGVNVTVEPLSEETADKYFEVIRLGGRDILKDVISENQSVRDYVNGSSDVRARKKMNVTTFLEGLEIELKPRYSFENLTIIDTSVLDGDVTQSITTYNADSFKTIRYPDIERYSDIPSASRSLIIVISAFEFNELNPDNIDVVFFRAFGIDIVLGELYFENSQLLEYGRVALADEMIFEFDNGPYESIDSIVTGLSGSAEPTDVNVIVNTVGGEGNINSLIARADLITPNTFLNIQAVCNKREAKRRG